MIRTLERYQTGFRISAGAMPYQTRQLDRSFNRFRPAVGEKCPAQSRELRQPLRQRPLKLVVIEIRNVNHLRRLIANRLYDPRMRMPERIHANPGNKIEILP